MGKKRNKFKISFKRTFYFETKVTTKNPSEGLDIYNTFIKKSYRFFDKWPKYSKIHIKHTFTYYYLSRKTTNYCLEQQEVIFSYLKNWKSVKNELRYVHFFSSKV